MGKFLKAVRNDLLMFTIVPESCFLCWTGKVFDESSWSGYMKWVVNIITGDENGKK